MTGMRSTIVTEAENTGGIAPASLGRGASIGRYVVLGLVGRGAMGEVYAAYDPELDRKVAVKLLRAQVGANDLTTSEAKARLLREAQAIAKLSHPNVIVVHDVGSFGDRVFVAMEFVDGNTVGYWLLAAKRSWRDVLRVFMAAGRGLASAHAAQLVHRDFKVENVMVGRDGQVRVMDFGLARRVAVPSDSQDADDVSPGQSSAAPVAGTGVAIDDDAITATRVLTPPDGSTRQSQPKTVDLEATRVTGPTRLAGGRPDGIHTSLSTELTQTGAIIGTPAYMAPEQFNGHAADERSDQFSFCVALYEGLHGERPFAGKTVGELSANVVKGRMRSVPDSSRVPSWLRRVVLRGLRVNPAERWQSMDALLAALQNDPAVVWRRWAMIAAATAAVVVIGLAARRQGARENRPTCHVPSDRFTRVWEVAASPGSRRAQIAAAFRKSGQAYATDSFSGTARLLDGYVGAWSMMYTESCEAAHVRGEQSAEVLDLRMTCLRDRWNELRALSDVLVEPNGEVVASAVKAAAALTPLDRCADVRTLRAAVPPPNDPDVRQQVETLRAKLATAKALEDAGRLGKALTATALLVSEARVAGYAPLLAEALARLGEVQLRLGRISEGEGNLDEAIWLGQATRYDRVVAEASIDQIFAAGSVDRDTTRARRWFRQAEAFLARMDGHELLRAWMLNNLGTALDAHGDMEEALMRYRGALQLKEKVLGGTHPDVGTSLGNLAGALTSLGRYQEALEHLNRSVTIVTSAFGREHPETALQLANRADTLNRLGRHVEARRDAEQALPIWERATAPDNAQLPYFLGPLGEALLGLEEPAQAVGVLDRALKIAEQTELRSELRRLRFSLARALWPNGLTRQRAIQLGVLAASAPGEPGAGHVLAEADRELQERAAIWVGAHQTESRNRGKVAGRFGSSPAL